MTPARDINVIIDEMIDHIDYVIGKTKALSIEPFQDDRDIRQSVERSLEIISEASRRLPADITSRKPEIPWRQVADFGNVLRHSYFAINIDIVWSIIKNKPLREALEVLRNELP